MAEQGHPNYLTIFWILLSVTIVEVGYSFMKVPRPVLIGGLVALAGFKALLVALYFMHLKFERKALGVIVGSTLILGVILVSVGIGEHVLPRP
ncbi:MAG TPA: cytochrome C oxidase subunit IV family protein [Thermoanaerobaculia bacterium]|jgi:cytochrome c oxidase subunit 4|nr:cytochrome C oxidase subunit IV family protein [Thermoanaerobaculia bacterium]